MASERFGFVLNRNTVHNGILVNNGTALTIRQLKYSGELNRRARLVYMVM